MASRDTIKVAAAQYALDPVESMSQWREKTRRWVTQGAASGAELLVFPEYGALEAAAAAGQDIAGDLQGSLAAVSEAMPEMNACWAELARAHLVHILATSGPARRGKTYVNAARLFTPAGRVGVQEKLIMTPFEQGWGISTGNGLKVFGTELGRLGVAICYDAEFPLIVRAQAEAGAELVLIPSCTGLLSGHSRVRTAARARALENQIATVVSSTVGPAPWSPAIDDNVGAAGVFVPPDPAESMTGVLAEGGLNDPGWVVREIDLAALRRLRGQGEVRNRTDWPLQPGAEDLAGFVEVQSLVEGADQATS